MISQLDVKILGEEKRLLKVAENMTATKIELFLLVFVAFVSFSSLIPTVSLSHSNFTFSYLLPTLSLFQSMFISSY